MRERRILLKVRDCPFLCHLNAAHQSQDRAYYIMEYLSGGSLEELLRRCGSLNIETTRFYTAEMVCGLQFLHGQNIIHRDMKPANIMLDGNGHIRIIDLGLARDDVTSSNKTRGAAGTLRYLAPEILLGEDYDAAVDWWSLGIIVSRMSSGCFPFTTVRLSINTNVQDLLSGLLQRNPKKRLGVKGNIRDHPFFTIICWEELEMRRAQPPFIPPKAVLKNQDLLWPEEQTLHAASSFSYVSPSWTRIIRA
ncbi:protein kinase C delta type-like [Leptodactylus fuscus]|uniref:protein kinase C delta type-like n=1 Tax=Leptodactylus fuscus TaxID=238119 RepID=UPI003F4EC35A